MRFYFLRQQWKSFLALIVFTFICSFVGSITGYNVIACLLAVAAYALWFIWFVRDYLQVRKTLILFNSGQYKETISLCEKLILRYPRDPNLRITAAAACIALSKPIKAAELADKAISLEPRAIQAYNNRAMARVQMNLFDEAMNDCNTAIGASQKSPQPLQAHLLGARATVYAQKGEIEEAITDCNNALALESKCIAALLLRSHCYCVKRQFTESLADTEAVIALSPPIAIKGIALSNRARVHLSTGNLKAALEDANEALKCYPDAPPLLSTRGLMYARNEQMELALDDLSRAIEIDPFYSEAYWFRHEVYEKLGQADKANADKAIATRYQYKPYL